MSSSYHTFRVQKPPNSATNVPSGTGTEEPTHQPVDEIPRTEAERLDTMFQALKRTKWKLGDFLYAVFQDNDHQYQGIVTKFLSGKSKVKPASIVQLMFEHSSSRPKSKASEETAIHYAQPAVFAWSLDVVLQKITAEVKKLIRDPELRVRASRKGAVQELLLSVAPEQSVPSDPQFLSNEGDGLGDRGSLLKELVEDIAMGASTDLETVIDDVEMGDAVVEREEGEESESESEGVAIELPENESIENPLEPVLADGSSIGLLSQASIKPRARGKGKDTLVTWEIIEKFSLASLKEKYQHRAPTVWRVMSELASGEKKPSRLGGIYRPKDIVSIISK
ncbi:hypothetical protein NLI96_g2537 [Meripilus lineatus]|uniref:Uncharacterized protein n=1 Tax=Meripilus lineatus TaxID=2056292 RepID=A0AAD5YJW5_9APHY|nr:hypothetical protein NLI96_g2537 [Physisporinus lineatus]